MYRRVTVGIERGAAGRWLSGTGVDGRVRRRHAAAAVKDVTTASFRQDVIAESMRQPVLVDFWAPWCGPCKQLGPIIEKAVAASAGKVKLVKMNIDEHPQIAGQLGIQSIPAVIAFQKGQPVDGFVGALPESQIKGFIERLVGPLGDPMKALLEEAEAADGAGRHRDGRRDLCRDPGRPTRATCRLWPGLAKLHLEAGDDRAGQGRAEHGDGQGRATIRPSRPCGPAIDLAEQSAGARRSRRPAAPGRGRSGRPSGPLRSRAGAERQEQRGEAADALIEIIRRDRNWNEEARASSCCNSSRPGARWTRLRSRAGASSPGCCSS